MAHSLPKTKETMSKHFKITFWTWNFVRRSLLAIILFLFSDFPAILEWFKTSKWRRSNTTKNTQRLRVGLHYKKMLIAIHVWRLEENFLLFTSRCGGVTLGCGVLRRRSATVYIGARLWHSLDYHGRFHGRMCVRARRIAFVWALVYVCMCSRR